MAIDTSFNFHSSVDLTPQEMPQAERVFISHRNFDKPLAEAVAELFKNLGVYYWFDREDEDIRRASALGMAGDQALVHAIERGVRHSSRVLGILSASTRGSWWVPYEIGISRGLGRPISFLVLESIRSMEALPEYVRLAANYWSLDELVRWVASLRASDSSTFIVSISNDFIKKMQKLSVPKEPPLVTICGLAVRALAAIDQLAKQEIWESLRLTSTEQFDWLPTSGGLVRDLAYDLLAPLAFFRLNRRKPVCAEQSWLELCYQAITIDYELARLPPPLAYYSKEFSWLQDLSISIEQLGELLDRFFLVPDLNHKRRLATKEEFKAEFDRVQSSSNEHERRSLGEFVNPLFGFTPTDRLAYWRVLALQQRLYEAIVNRTSHAIFDEDTNLAVEHFIKNDSIEIDKRRVSWLEFLWEHFIKSA